MGLGYRVAEWAGMEVWGKGGCRCGLGGAKYGECGVRSDEV